MVSARGLVAGALLLGSLGLAGCGKTVDLTLVNLTREALDVHLASPGCELLYVGILPPVGTMEQSLRIDEKELPAECAWMAGPYGARFIVERSTPRRMRVEVGPPGGP